MTERLVWEALPRKMWKAELWVGGWVHVHGIIAKRKYGYIYEFKIEGAVKRQGTSKSLPGAKQKMREVFNELHPAMQSRARAKELEHASRET